jgi:plastocyanin
MRTSWYSLALGCILGVAVIGWSAPTALAQHHSGGHSSGHHASSVHHGSVHYGGGHYGGYHGGYGGYHNGYYHNHYSRLGFGGVGIYLGAYPYAYGSYDPYYSGYYYDTPYYVYPNSNFSYYNAAPSYDSSSYDSYYFPPANGGIKPVANQLPADLVNVTITDNMFLPDQLTINAGQTVRWTNTGQYLHSLAQPEFNWKTKNLNTGQGYTWTFDTPGTYELIDPTFADMRMTVIVK